MGGSDDLAKLCSSDEIQARCGRLRRVQVRGEREQGVENDDGGDDVPRREVGANVRKMGKVHGKESGGRLWCGEGDGAKGGGCGKWRVCRLGCV